MMLICLHEHIVRQEIVYNARPNPGHYAIAKLEEAGVVRAVVTQNVDGLHQRAGSRRVVELHGSLWRARCTKCGAVYRLERPVEEVPPRCPRCGSLCGQTWCGSASRFHKRRGKRQ